MQHITQQSIKHCCSQICKTRIRYLSTASQDAASAKSGDMEVTFLGTGSSTPTISRGVSCMALRNNSNVWLFDCGESSQRQLQRGSIKVSHINKIFLTHLHGDHAFGLPGVLCFMGLSRLDDSLADSEVIDIYGPEGTRDFVRATIQLTHSKIVPRHRIHELKNVTYWNGHQHKLLSPVQLRTEQAKFYKEETGSDIYPDEQGHYQVLTGDTDTTDMQVTAACMRHTVPCVGYAVTELPKAGRLRVEYLDQIVARNKEALRLQYGQPQVVFKTLKNLQPGHSFVFADGTSVSHSDCLDQPRKGRKVVFMGDTSSGEQMKPLATDCDLLVHESTNAWFNPQMYQPLGQQAYQQRFGSYAALAADTRSHGHSTPEMAGYFARQVGAQRLVLSHFSSRYGGDRTEHSVRVMRCIENMARGAMDNTGSSSSNNNNNNNNNNRSSSGPGRAHAQIQGHYNNLIYSSLTSSHGHSGNCAALTSKEKDRVVAAYDFMTLTIPRERDSP